MFKFPKKQKLCNETAIKKMFSNGKSFVVEPIRLVWKVEENTDKEAIKSIIVVPKKKLNLASTRSIVRRRMKEAYRLNKIELEASLNSKNIQLNIAVIYQVEEILPYKVIEEKIKLILGRLSEEI
ncbi:ribonuclease P protein component [Flavobacteriales bacterium]|nr:ribonuclease P protein component [Flavobacteriales bacterium]